MPDSSAVSCKFLKAPAVSATTGKFDQRGFWRIFLVRVSKVLSLAFKSPKHEIYHGNMNESGARFGQHFVILA
ncbi:MAG: hypothetical protein NTV00_06700, partial [Methylococcales bacterium]|nr:hypothetical protein [Methylococcales bacterium]